jgi:hypothetical protein
VTRPLNPQVVRHLARTADESTRHEAERVQVLNSTPLDERHAAYSVSRRLTQDEVTAYVVAALDVARKQLAPLAEPGAVRVELVQDVQKSTWASLGYRQHVREHMRARWASDLELQNLRPATWPPITATPDRARHVVRLSIAGLAVPIPTEEQHP